MGYIWLGILAGVVAGITWAVTKALTDEALRLWIARRRRRGPPADVPLMPGAHLPRQDRPNHGQYEGLARLSCTNCGKVTLQEVYSRDGFHVGLCSVCGVPTRRPDDEAIVLLAAPPK